MRAFTATVIVPFVLAGALTGGCGGDDDGRLARAELVERGNGVCGALTTRLRAALADVDVTDPAAIAAAVAARGVPALRDAVDAFDDLRPPASLERDLDAFVDELRAVTERIAGDPSLVTSAATDPFTRFDRLARDLGLDACAGDGTGAEK